MKTEALSPQCLFKNVVCPTSCALYPDNPESIEVDRFYSNDSGILHIVSEDGGDMTAKQVNPASLWEYCELTPAATSK